MLGNSGGWMRGGLAGGLLALLAGGPLVGSVPAGAEAVPPAAELWGQVAPATDTIPAADRLAEQLERMNARIDEVLERLAEAQRLRGVDLAEGARVLSVRGEALSRMLDTVRLQAAREMPRIERLGDGVMLHFENLMTVRPRLGLTLEDRAGLDDAARVAGVAPGSGAADAGIVTGDEVLAVDGTRLRRTDEASPVEALIAQVRDRAEGDTVRLLVRRDGSEREVRVQVRAPERLMTASPGVIRLREGTPRPPVVVRAPAAPRALAAPGTPGTVRLQAPGVEGVRLLEAFTLSGARGLRLADLNEGLSGYFGRDTGALILELFDGAPEGVRAGDVIIGIDGRPVADAADARRILASYRSGETVRFELWREGRATEVSSAMR